MRDLGDIREHGVEDTEEHWGIWEYQGHWGVYLEYL